MKMLFDFQCKDGHKQEALVDKATFEIVCLVCGEASKKVLSIPKFKLEGWSGDFPSKASRWEREHEEAGARGRERRREEEFYTPTDPSSLL